MSESKTRDAAKHTKTVGKRYIPFILAALNYPPSAGSAA